MNFKLLVLSFLISTYVLGQQPQYLIRNSTPTNFSTGQLALTGSVIWQEDFENSGNAFPYNGLTTAAADTSSKGFERGDVSNSNTGIGFVVPASSRFAFTNDDACNCNKSQDELLTPNLTFSGVNGAILQFRAYVNRVSIRESAEIWVEDGSSWTKIGELVSDPNWVQYEFKILGSGINNPKIKFVYNDGGSWGSGLAIDDIGVFNPANVVDLKLDSFTVNQDEPHEFYTHIPETHANGMALAIEGSVSNNSTKTATNAVLHSQFSGQMSQHDTTLLGNISGFGSNKAFTNQSVFASSGTGTYHLKVFTQSDSTETDTQNDTLKLNFEVTDTTYSRVGSDKPNRSFWYGPDINYAIFSMVEISGIDTATSISVYLDSTTRVGDSIDVLIYSEFLQDRVKDTFPQINERIIIESKHLNRWYNFKIPESTLSPGKYFVGIRTRGKRVIIGVNDKPVRRGLAYASSGGIFNPVDYMPFVQLHLKGKKCQAINVIEQVTPSGCGANNGQLQITPLGGNPPYRIQWGKQAGYSKAVLVSGLSSGNYSYQVIDTFGCVQKGIIALPDSGSPILTLDSIRHENCFGDSLGYLKIKASGGTPPYQFSWADGSTDSLRAQLTADSYRLEVSDASSGGCKAYASYSIQGPREKLSAKALVQDNLCASDTLGEILWEIRGGVEPYSWLWSDTSLKKLHEKNLAPGRYHITFSDNNNCQYVDSAQIESNDSILVVGQVDDTSKTASITLTVSGGVSPYTFSWKSSVTGFSDPGTQNLTGLIDRGIYVATTIDSVGCSRVDTFTVAGTLNIQFSDEKQSELKIFPNPSTGRITLVWNSLESANLSIVDVHGRVVEEKYNATSGVQFELPQGIYWVLHHQEGHETQRLKVVVVN